MNVALEFVFSNTNGLPLIVRLPCAAALQNVYMFVVFGAGEGDEHEEE